MRGRMEGHLEAGNRFPDGAGPKDEGWRGLPRRARWEEQRFVPLEAAVEAADGRGFSKLGGAAGDLLGNEMLWVPKLACARVRNARERGASRRTPIGRKYGLPDHQNAKSGIAFVLEKFADCGDPPQAIGSSGRNEEHEARAGRSRVKRTDELRDVGRAKRGERLLSLRRATRNPEIGGQADERGNESEGREQGPPFHFD